MTFLHDFLKTVSDGALKRVIEQFASQRKAVPSKRVDVQQFKDLLSHLADASRLAAPGEHVDSRAFNKVGEQVYLVLSYLFSLYDELDRIVTNHCRLLDSQVSDIRRGVAQLQAACTGAEQMVFEEDFSAPRFVVSGGFEHIDPDGRRYGPEFSAVVRYGLTMVPYVDRDCLRSGGESLPVKIKIVRRTGMLSPLVRSRPEKIFDGQVSAWQEVVWASAPLRIAPGVAYGASPDDVVFYGDASGGAFCELWFDFRYPTVVSEFLISPAAPFPLELVSLILYEDYGKSAWHKVASNIRLDGPQVVRFSAVPCVRVRLLLRQQHYERKTYVLRREQLEELWLEELSQKGSWRPEVTDPAKRDYLEQFPGLEAFLSEWPNMPDEVVRSYCEYVYGLREVEVRERNYRDVSVMVSEPFPVLGCARTVELETEEEHPQVVISGRSFPVTSIEYYIGCDGVWLPIHPKGKEVVERIFGSEHTFRFKVLSDLRVYRNGFPYDRFTVTGDKIVINDYDPYAIYTARYIPDPSAYLIEFPAVVQPREFVASGRRGERFDETDSSGAIVLTYAPFVDRGDLVRWQELSGHDVPRALVPTGNSPLRVFVHDGSGYVEYTNVTDYVYGTVRVPGDGEFVHQKRTVKFAGPIDRPIIVYYKYLGGDVRLKAVMRRNLHGYSSLTCVLKRYRLRFFG